MSTHLPSDLMLSYVTGGVPRPFSVLIASHLAFCAKCRAEAAALEAIGGGFFENLAGLEVEAVPQAELAAALARLDEPEPQVQPTTEPKLDDETAKRLPKPMHGLVGRSIGSLPWREVLRGLSVVELASLKEEGARARLVLTRRGLKVPRHTHDGTELTLVLSGGLTAEQGHFRRGEVMVVEPGEVHRPIMDEDEDCLCLAVTDGPVRFTGLIGRARQILAGY